MKDVDQKLDELLAYEGVRQCLMRYSRAIDRIDEALLRTAYWPEAVDNHGSYNGPAEGFIAWVIPLLGTMEQTMHFLGNILIELDGDTARSETYFLALHRLQDGSGKLGETHVAGRYLDRMERRGDEWRIVHRDVVYDGLAEVDSPADWAKGVFGLQYQSHRGPDDISYRLFGEK